MQTERRAFRTGLPLVIGLLGLFAVITASCGDAESGVASGFSTQESRNSAPAAVEYNLTYRPGTECMGEGAPWAVIAVDASGDRMADLDGDGVADVIRGDEFVEVRLDPDVAASLGLDGRWISIPADIADPINRFAALTRLRVDSALLLVPGLPYSTERFPYLDFPGVREDAVRLDPERDGYQFESNPSPYEGRGPTIVWSEDENGHATRMLITYPDDQESTDLQEIRVHRLDSTELQRDPSRAPTEFATVDAAAALMLTYAADDACNGESKQNMEARRACFKERAEGMDVSTWVDTRPYEDLLPIYGCQIYPEIPEDI